MVGDKNVELKRPNSPQVVQEVENKPYNIVEKQFLHNCKGTQLNIFLSSGVKLDCTIVSFDDISLVTTQKDNIKKKQLVYKHSVCTIAEK